MTERVGLLDTGPLVSFLAADVQYHAWTVGQWKELRPPLLTCEPALTEAVFLLRRADFKIYRRHGNKVIPVRMPE